MGLQCKLMSNCLKKKINIFHRLCNRALGLGMRRGGGRGGAFQDFGLGCAKGVFYVSIDHTGTSCQFLYASI